MNYDEIIQETNAVIRRVMLHNDIATWGISALLAGLILAVGWFAWTEHREKMRLLRAQRQDAEWDGVRTGQYYTRM